MEFVFKPTLQHLALVKIAVQLWIQNDATAKFSTSWGHERFLSTLFQGLTKKVDTLVLPDRLKTQLLNNCIKPIGRNISEWYYHDHGGYKMSPRMSSRELRWTAAGTIDTKSTARALVLNDRLDLVPRFKLACVYCFEEEIRLLYGRMNPEQRQNLHERDVRCGYLIKFWSYYVDGKVDQYRHADIRVNRDLSVSLYYFVFLHALCNNYHSAAVEFFFTKLTAAEKTYFTSKFERMLRKRFASRRRDRNFKENVRRLLFSMTEFEREEMLRRSARYSLQTLLTWPYQDMFLPAVNRNWEFISGGDVMSLLSYIYFDDGGGKYRDLAPEFWRSSPEWCKRFVLYSQNSPWDKLCRLWDEGQQGKEMCKMMLNEATADEMEGVLFNDAAKCLYARRIKKKDWKFLKFMIDACNETSDENTINTFVRLLITYDVDRMSPDHEYVEEFIQFFDNLSTD